LSFVCRRFKFNLRSKERIYSGDETSRQKCLPDNNWNSNNIKESINNWSYDLIEDFEFDWHQEDPNDNEPFDLDDPRINITLLSFVDRFHKKLKPLFS
jgi:hypothetical protein